MATSHPSPEDLLAEIADLRNRLEEAEDTLRAIREGEVDALVVYGPGGEQIYTLKGADHSYRILIEAINEGAAILAPDGDILYGNQQLAELLGAPLERLVGTCICDYVEAADRELLMALLEHGRQDASKGEVSLRNRNGVIVPGYLSFRSFNLEEVPGAVCLVATDLTQQKRQEAILAEEQLSRAIFEQVEAAILVVDPEGRILRASQEAHQICRSNLLLRQFDEVFRLAIFDTTGGKSGPADCKPFPTSSILKGKVFHGLEVRFSPPEGREPLEMLLNAGPLRDSQGKVMGAVVALTDITERKRVEEALKQAHEELEQRVKNRTAELRLMVAQLQEEVTNRLQAEESLKESEARLRHLSSRLLDAQESERKRLAVELHDELGHALLTVKLQLRALERGLTPEQKKLAEDIEALQPFIDGVLDNVRRLYFRLSPGNLEDLGLTGALRQMLDEFGKHHKDIRWQIRLDNLDQEFTPLTQTVIYRIVQEILTNIGKHAKPSRVSVRVTRNPTTALFTVEDNGSGFDTSQIRSLDDPNRGLGLAAMEERVRMQGGTLEIVSRENQGTRIAFTLPLGSGRE
ncbi:MAG: PAS domain-containing sensor histidine kinase [Deltaproteobacteria bacterium]|nr:MAG: PAS domain-containing sensor histidine kinase [Deltaproteobacteria bacterium]